MTVLLIAFAVVVIAVAVALHKHSRKHIKRLGGWPAILVRILLTGHHWDGVNRCDRGWFRWGITAMEANQRHPKAVLTPWVRAPRLLRLCAAWCALAVPVLIADGMLAAPGLTEAALVVTGTVTVSAAGYRGARHLTGRRHRREVTVPLAAALASTPAGSAPTHPFST